MTMHVMVLDIDLDLGKRAYKKENKLNKYHIIATVPKYNIFGHGLYHAYATGRVKQVNGVPRRA